MKPLPRHSPIVECLRAVAQVSAQTCATALGSGPAQGNDVLQGRQLATIWRLVDDYQRVAGGPVSLSDILARITHELVASRDTLLLWVDAIESIIQAVEEVYGRAPGQGEYKAAQVKAAVVYMIEKADGRLQSRTLLLTEGGLEVVVSFIIDGIVLLLNHRGLWQLTPEEAARLSAWLRLRTRIMLFLLDVVGTIYRWIEGRKTLLPAVRAIADRTARQREGNLLVRLSDFMEFVLWCGEHRRQLLALLDLASTAAVEAEAFVRMSGSEKQRYARELVLLVLREEFPGWPDTPVWNTFAGAAIDLAIDGVVRIFNKRGVFAHSNAESPSAIAAAVPAWGNENLERSTS